MSNDTGIVQFLKKEQDRLTKELRGISAALAAFGKAYGTETSARKVSASARARMAAAQKARWAKARETAKVVPSGRRTPSAAARKKMAAAQRARWAHVKAAKKSA
jgi:ABC-type hemin transport system substrate-binding protein